MASLASLANLGSVNTMSFGNFDGSVCLVWKVTFPGNGCSLRRFWSPKRWRYSGVCRYSSTINYIAEQGTTVFPDKYGVSKENDSETFLKAAPKPVLKSVTKIGPLLTMPWAESKLGGDIGNEKISERKEERSKVMETLEEVLEKAEEVETSKKVNVSVNNSLENKIAKQKNGKPVNVMGNSNSKSKTSKSVWRKGNPVATVQKVIKEPRKQEHRRDGEGVIGSKLGAPFRPPQPPQRDQPKLQAKPSADSPPLNKKPPVLNDVNVAKNFPISDGTYVSAKTKERKSILVDKFSSKKPMVDPLIAQPVMAPPKPGKSPAPGKFKDEFRKKSGPSGGLRSRMANEDNGIPEDTYGQ